MHPGPTFRAALMLAVALAAAAPAASAASQQSVDAVTVLLRKFEQTVQNADGAAFLSLLADSADRTRSLDFASTELLPGATRVVIQERDRQPLPGTLPEHGYRVMVDAFAEYGGRARVATWLLDVKKVGTGGNPEEWAIADEERVSSVESLYRLSLSATKQFTARDLTISAEDLELVLVEGSVFVVEIDQGVTGFILLGNGTLKFHPTPQTEQGQVKIFCGSETLEARFDALFLRVNPSDVADLVDSARLQPRPVDARELRRAQEIFRTESPKSFVLDLGDLSRDPWSLLPGPGDVLAEIRTRRFDTLTYARSSSEAEDISLFDRRKHRNIAIYASKQRIATRGRFYNEDELVDYDVLDYDLDIAAMPERHFIEGRARVRLKVRSFTLGSLTLKLADSLVVQSIISTEYGRLFGIRVKNQNSLVINLPVALPRDKELTLNISYAGRLEPQAPDRETLALQQAPPRAMQEDVPVMIAAEANWLYSSRSYWYPQGTVSDYATATIRISVPASLECVASGELQNGFPVLMPAKEGTAANRKLYLFVASQPLRYLAFIVSRFVRAETMTIAFPQATNSVHLPSAQATHSLNLSVEANPRQTARGRDYADRAAAIATFYQSILGDMPYPSFTVAVIENDLPGGHSPGYFAALNQPLPSSNLSWRNDPAAFNGFPDFFIAHELAHQWWGQAVGWRNYHEQWISEGFAQYFAGLYAQHQRGDDTFNSFMRQCRRWGIEQSDQGPIYLGYRLGHIRGESRIFRALVYNKSAAVLHMLRRLVGDEAFFRGVRRFYEQSRFHKAGTEDFRLAMEAEAGRPLQRFFERWIYGSTLPQLRVSHRVEGNEVVLHIEQVGELFDVPLTLSLQYSDRKNVDVPVAVSERTTDVHVPLAGSLRGVDISKDDGTMAEIVRN
jgi:peptidase M1-like protein